MDPREQSLLAAMLESAGETLDKPGRFFRGLGSTALNYGSFGYMGKADPRAMLNIIPLSDTFGLTDPKAELHANEAYFGGAPSDGTFSGGLMQAAGDILTDPSTYLSFGSVPVAKMLFKAPKVLGYSAKASNLVPEVVAATSKVVPEVVTAATKVVPEVVPSVVSTSKSFNDMTSAGINAMENIASMGGKPLGSSSGDTIVNKLADFSYGNAVPKPLPDVAPVASNISDYLPFAYDSGDNYFKSVSRAANKAPKVSFKSPPLNTLQDFDYMRNLGDAANYAQDIQKIDPLSNTIGSFSKVADNASDIGRIKGFAEEPVTSSYSAIIKGGENNAPVIDDLATVVGMPFNYLDSVVENSFLAKPTNFAGKLVATQLGNLGSEAPVFGPMRDFALEVAPKFMSNMRADPPVLQRQPNGSIGYGSPDESRRKYLERLNSDEF